MTFKRWVIVGLFVLAVAPRLSAEDFKKRDDMGVWERSRSYPLFERQPYGRIFNLREQDTFMAVWSATAEPPKQVLFLLHGTHGTPYEELKDEYEWARRYNMGLVGIHWFMRPPSGYLKPEELYPVLCEASDIVRHELKWPMEKAAVMGFSRGSASLMQVAKDDNADRKLFRRFVMISGGAPTNAVLAKGESTRVDPFFDRFNKRSWPKDMYQGQQFWLYSGLRDEEWGQTMSDYMKNAKEGIEAFGGQVVAWVNDPSGGHMGPKKNPAQHQQVYEFLAR